MGLLDKLKNFFGLGKSNQVIPRELARKMANDKYSATDIQAIGQGYIDGKFGIMDLYGAWTGDRYQGHFGLTKDLRVLNIDILRERSRQLYRENTIVGCIFRRHETKIVNRGMTLEAAPCPEILGPVTGWNEEALQDWATRTEILFNLYASKPSLIDWRTITNNPRGPNAPGKTLGQIQREAWRTSKLSGFVLLILRYTNGHPNLQLIDGADVRTPYDRDIDPGLVKYGIQFDKLGNEIGYYVTDGVLRSNNVSYKNKEPFKSVYIPRFTPNGRLQAWRFNADFGLINDVVPSPLLSVLLGNLKEIDRTIDAEQRARALSSNLVWYMKRNQPTMPMTSFGDGAQKIDFLAQLYNTLPSGHTDEAKQLALHTYQPGMEMPYLQHGEEPAIFDTSGRDSRQLCEFLGMNIEISSASIEMPPEMLFMKYGKSYSAARQTNNDYETVKTKEHSLLNKDVNCPFYSEWLLSMVVKGKIPAPMYAESYLNEELWDIQAAWNNSEWNGLVEQPIDPNKFIDYLERAEDRYYLDPDLICRKWFGTSYRKNVRRAAENQKLLKSLKLLGPKPSEQKLLPSCNDGEDEKEEANS